MFKLIVVFMVVVLLIQVVAEIIDNVNIRRMK